jgi:hypothetical protein
LRCDANLRKDAELKGVAEGGGDGDDEEYDDDDEDEYTTFFLSRFSASLRDGCRAENDAGGGEGDDEKEDDEWEGEEDENDPDDIGEKSLLKSCCKTSLSELVVPGIELPFRLFGHEDR